MRRLILGCVLMVCCLQVGPTALALAAALSDGDESECMVIGNQQNPAKAREFFEKARAAWAAGEAEQARVLYEQALINDRGILALDDGGIGLNLLGWYRKQAEAGSATPALLCRLGYFENVLFGNLEAAVEQYRRAGETAVASNVRDLAFQESERLARELRYLKDWQRNRADTARRQSDVEVRTYVETRRQSGIRDQIEDLQAEMEELEHRLVYLGQQEGKTQEELFHALWRAQRYRRIVYFDVPNEAEVPDPMGSYYYSRNQAEQLQNQIAQIRAERTGIEKRLKAIDKEIRDLEKREAGGDPAPKAVAP